MFATTQFNCFARNHTLSWLPLFVYTFIFLNGGNLSCESVSYVRGHLLIIAWAPPSLLLHEDGLPLPYQWFIQQEESTLGSLTQYNHACVLLQPRLRDTHMCPGLRLGVVFIPAGLVSLSSEEGVDMFWLMQKENRFAAESQSHCS